MDQVEMDHVSSFKKSKSWGRRVKKPENNNTLAIDASSKNSAAQILTQQQQIDSPPNVSSIKTEPDPDQNNDVLTNMCLSNTHMEDKTVLHNLLHNQKWSDTRILPKILKIESIAEGLPMQEPTSTTLDTNMLDFDLDLSEYLKIEVVTSGEEICLTGNAANSWNESEAEISDFSTERTKTEHSYLTKAWKLSKKGKSIKKKFKCPNCKMSFSGPHLALKHSAEIHYKKELTEKLNWWYQGSIHWCRDCQTYLGRSSNSIIHHWATKHNAICEVAKPELIPQYVMLEQESQQHFQKTEELKRFLEKQKLQIAEVKVITPRRILVRKPLNESEEEKKRRKIQISEQKMANLKEKIQCPECTHSFATGVRTFQHALFHHYRKEMNELLEEEFKVKKTKKCMKCKTKVMNLSQYKWHMTYKHKAMHPCIRKEFLPQYDALWNEMTEKRKQRRKLPQGTEEASSCENSAKSIISECSQSEAKNEPETSYNQILETWSDSVPGQKVDKEAPCVDLITIKEEFNLETESV